MRDAHAASAAAGDGLDHHRITDAFGDDQGVLFVFDDAFRAGRRGHAGLFGQRAADGLVFQGVHGARTRADETDVAAFANVGEMGVFGKKTVAGMDGIHIGDFRRADDAVDAQVTFVAGGFADADGFVGQLDVHGICVRLRIDGHGADIQFLAGADDADGNFSAVGYQNFFEHVALGEHEQGSSGRAAAVSVRTNFEQRLAEFDRLGIFDQNLGDDAFGFGFDFVHHLHRFNDANDRVRD